MVVDERNEAFAGRGIAVAPGHQELRNLSRLGDRRHRHCRPRTKSRAEHSRTLTGLFVFLQTQSDDSVPSPGSWRVSVDSLSAETNAPGPIDSGYLSRVTDAHAAHCVPRRAALRKPRAGPAWRISLSVQCRPPPLAAHRQRAGYGAPRFSGLQPLRLRAGREGCWLRRLFQDAIGDFPAKWNTNAAGEIVTVAGKPGRWLKLTRAGAFVPELTPTLPDNFTLEFDLLVPPAFNSGYLFNASIVELDDVRRLRCGRRRPTASRSRRGPAAARCGRPPGLRG